MWRQSLTRVRGQVIMFQRWRPDFDVHVKNVTTKLVWIKFPNLPLEYWHQKILLTMAKAAWRTMALDRCSRSAAMGTFSRVQVEVKEAEVREEGQHEGTIPGAIFVDEEGGDRNGGHREGGNPVCGASKSGRISSHLREESPSLSVLPYLRKSNNNIDFENLNGKIQIVLPSGEERDMERKIPCGGDVDQIIEGENDLKEYGSNSEGGSEDGLDGGSVDGPKAFVEQ
ncbi:uncharacterized protein LOC122069452 [Macadamia integrifolia]|uniref:uncharacterized protein LOC122069452 n=1 Tax=Macadamia integrifolia TaxID=60698 RepID=UPI001C4FA143|nr:uncharacterized protein LOC122069452 [Macadamia integrifolia]